MAALLCVFLVPSLAKFFLVVVLRDRLCPLWEETWVDVGRSETNDPSSESQRSMAESAMIELINAKYKCFYGFLARLFFV